MPNPSKIVKGILQTGESASDALRAAKMARRVDPTLSMEEIHAQRMANLAAAQEAETLGVPPAGLMDQIKSQRVSNELTLRTERLRQTDRQAFDIQTETPSEFRQRYREQLSNFEFASRAVTDTESPHLTDVIRKSSLRDIMFQAKVNKKILANPRARKRAEGWVGDSPYVNSDGSPRIFVHIDRQTDPTRIGSKDFVQFERPRELGMHSGTNDAAITAGFRSTDAGLQQMSAFDDFTDDILGLLDGFDREQVQTMLVDSMDQYFVKKFTKDHLFRPDYETFDEIRDVLSGVLRDVGVPNPEQEIGKYLGKLKQLPTANSTPHYFRGKNGLYLRDEGGFGPESIYKQLRDLYPDDEQALQAAMSPLGMEEKSKKLQAFIESKGYDHVIYNNSVEDLGSTSIINWNPDLFVSIYSDEIVGTDPRALAGAISAFLMGASQVEVDDAELRKEL